VARAFDLLAWKLASLSVGLISPFGGAAHR